MTEKYKTNNMISGKERLALFEILVDQTKYDREIEDSMEITRLKKMVSDKGFIGGHRIWAKI